MAGTKLSGIAAAGLLAGSLVLALFSELLPPPAVAIPCRLLPNGVVPLLAPWNADCPLDAYDRVLAKRVSGDAVELFVSRRGDEGWVRLVLPIGRRFVELHGERPQPRMILRLSADGIARCPGPRISPICCCWSTCDR